MLVSVVINGLRCGVALPTTLSWRPASHRWDILLPDGGLRRSLIGLKLSWSAMEVPRPEDVVFDSGACRALYRPTAGLGSGAVDPAAVQRQEKPLAFGCMLELAGSGISSVLPTWSGRNHLRPFPEVMEGVLTRGTQQGELLFGVIRFGADGSTEASALQPADDRHTAKYVWDARLGGRLTGMQRSEAKALKLICQGRSISWAIGEAVEGRSVQIRLLVMCVHDRIGDDGVHQHQEGGREGAQATMISAEGAATASPGDGDVAR